MALPPQPRVGDQGGVVVCVGTMAALVQTAVAEHVVGNRIVLPGVGYVEMASACSHALLHSAVTFVRPCSLGELNNRPPPESYNM